MGTPERGERRRGRLSEEKRKMSKWGTKGRKSKEQSEERGREIGGESKVSVGGLRCRQTRDEKGCGRRQRAGTVGGGRREYSAAKIAKWGRENAVGRDDAESGGGPGQGREARDGWGRNWKENGGGQERRKSAGIRGGRQGEREEGKGQRGKLGLPKGGMESEEEGRAKGGTGGRRYMEWRLKSYKKTDALVFARGTLCPIAWQLSRR